MTTKLFWQDPYLQQFSGQVEQIRPAKASGSVELRLDQTAFYPEGGGQPSDQGNLNNHPVSYVYTEDAAIWHVVNATENAFNVGDSVIGVLNWPRRFDHMQQHLGQHILSSVFEDPFEARTIGFHLGEYHVTIDLDKGPFTQEELEKAEEIANSIVFDNRSVVSSIVTDDAYHALSLRKTPDITDEVRLVEIPNADLCACGGTHPVTTGEVGLIKIMKSETYKGGCRLSFLCGERALKAFQQIQLQAQQAASSLSVGWPELTETVKGLMQENKFLAKDNKDIYQLWSYLESDRLLSEALVINGVSLVMLCDDSMEYKQLTFLANAFREVSNCIALLGVTNPSPRFILLNTTKHPALSMANLLKESLHHIDGKGGGNASSAQGGGDRSEGLHPMLSEIQTTIVATLTQKL